MSGRVRAGWSGLGAGLFVSAWPAWLDVLVGVVPGPRVALFSFALGAAALGAARLHRHIGPLAAAATVGGGTIVAVVLLRLDAPGWLVAGASIVPAATAFGALAARTIGDAAWLVGLGIGLAVGGVFAAPAGPLPIAVVAVAALLFGVGRPAASERARPTLGGSLELVALAGFAACTAAATPVAIRLAAEAAHGGSWSARAALPATGLALALAALLPLGRPVAAAVAAASAAGWSLAAVLVHAGPSSAAGSPGGPLALWIAVAALAAVPGALALAASRGLLAARPSGLAAMLAAGAAGLPIGVFGTIPAIGLQASGTALAALALAGALVIAAGPRRTGVRSIPLLGGAVLVALVGLVVIVVAAARPAAPATLNDGQAIARVDGPSTTATLWADTTDGALRWITADGIAIGQSYGGIDPVQQLLAQLPFAVRPERPPRRAALVGHGLGTIAGSMLRHASLDELVVVEPAAAISRTAGDGASDASADEQDGARRPRVVRDDPWRWLERDDGQQTFDAIVVAGRLVEPALDDDRLWSLEFNLACASRLSDDGLVVRPLPLDLDAAELSTIVASFLPAFPSVELWLAPPTHGVLVGAARPPTLEPAAIDRLLRSPAAADLRRYGWLDGATAISMLTADREDLLRLAGDAAPHTLARRRLATLGRPDDDERRVRRAASLARLLELRPAQPDWDGLAGYDVPSVESHHLAATRLIEAFEVLGARRIEGIAPALSALRAALAAAPTHGLVVRSLDAIVSIAAELAPDDAEVRTAVAERLLAAGRADEAERELREALRVDPRRGVALALLGRALAMQRRYDAAANQLDNAIAFGADTPRVRFEHAVALRLAGRRERAAEAIERLLAASPDDPAALEQRALLLLGGPGPTAEELSRALADAEQAVARTGGRLPGVLHTLALAQSAAGRPDEAVLTAERALVSARRLGATALEPQLLETLRRFRAQAGGG